MKLIKDLLRPPKRDLRDNPRNNYATYKVDNGVYAEDIDATLTGDIIQGFIEEMQLMNFEEERDRIIIDSANVNDKNDSSEIETEVYI